VDFYEAFQKKALAAVLRPDEDAFLRHVFRFYSKTFHVPLPEVDDLPLDHVLTSYYEEGFENMGEEDREEYKERLTETPEERTERLAKEKAAEAADDEFFEKLNKEVAEGRARLPKERKVAIPPSNLSATARAAAVKNAIKSGVLEGNPQPAPEPPPLPDIHMNFSAPGGNLEGEVGDLDPLSSLLPKVQ
jgi:succinate dehydrogenase flavin-adding protein (antitoxin of CptAB toxin-antitoxin module)